MAATVALVVDNPLRDLDGLVLLAWQLAKRGATAYLVPMYRQAFDIPALKPDFALVNYLRPNNGDLLLLYRSLGISVGVLDTEGAGGKDAQHFAAMVSRMDCARYLDMYCVWGEGQYQAFRSAGILEESRLHLTGCPRFDFCAAPWRDSLPSVSSQGFVLINTNFPTVNPRFSRQPEQEVISMVQAGYEESFARQFIADAQNAWEGMIGATRSIARAYPDTPFILRPHPFENEQPYTAIDLPNVEVQQSGTVLPWLAASRLLIHQNCSTAVEATMLGVEPLSLDWLSTEALYLEGPTVVSTRVRNECELIEQVGRQLTGTADPPDASVLKARRALIRAVYFRVDGQSASRVADAILSHLRAFGMPSANVRHSGLSRRTRIVRMARNLLGFRAAEWMHRYLGDDFRRRAVAAKAFSVEQVTDVLRRIGEPLGVSVRAEHATTDTVLNQRQLSGHTVCVRATPFAGMAS